MKGENLDMEELIQKIILKAYKISTEKKAAVFVAYSGHINSLCIYLYKNGWQENVEWDFKLDFVLEQQNNAIEKLKLILCELEKIEKGD